MANIIRARPLTSLQLVIEDARWFAGAPDTLLVDARPPRAAVLAVPDPVDGHALITLDQSLADLRIVQGRFGHVQHGRESDCTCRR